MSNSRVLASIQGYVEGLKRRDEGYTEKGLRGFNWHKAELAGCDLSGLDLRKLDMSGAKLNGANLRDANLSGANLERANLRGAELIGANLSDADLRRLDMSGADLSNADLRDADLFGTNLTGAKLWGANLEYADLSEADLRGADLSEAKLNGADLWKANLSGANLSGAVLNWDEIPLVPNIDAAILSTLEGGGTLDMEEWHTCETTHSRAGWAVVLAGEEGRELEEQLGTNAAAALIYARSGSHPVPSWYDDNRTALEDIKSRAELYANNKVVYSESWKCRFYRPIFRDLQK